MSSWVFAKCASKFWKKLEDDKKAEKEKLQLQTVSATNQIINITSEPLELRFVQLFRQKHLVEQTFSVTYTVCTHHHHLHLPGYI